jgi:hypothetical protein
LENWENRFQKKNEMVGTQEFEERSRNVFYDTDHIAEKQKESLRICPDCSGTLQIDSSSDRGQRILAIHIPRKACNECKDHGYRAHETADTKRFDSVILQDRTEDTYVQ